MSSSVTLQSIRKSGSKFELNAQTALVAISAIIFLIAPFDISQLVYVTLGALGYAVLQGFTRSGRTPCQRAADREQRTRAHTVRPGAREHCRREATPANAAGLRPIRWQERSSARCLPDVNNEVRQLSKPDVYQQSQVPVVAPKFRGNDWESEVNELISQLIPASDQDKAIQRLVQHVKQNLQVLFPEVEVTGFAHGSVNCGKAFGVAVPEVDIVATVSPVVLAQRLQYCARHPQSHSEREVKLKKTAIRMCTDRLVQLGGLKFRRTALRADEARVTLLVPPSLGIFTDPIPVDFTVNSVTPFYSAALLSECGQIEPRAKSLILFVRRWAKDRGICHAAKGHLSPYFWSLLVIYFMQVGVESEGPLLPVAAAFAISSGSAKQSSSRKSASPRRDDDAGNTIAKNTVGQLFRAFVHFYSEKFNWRNEAVSIRLGQRAPPSASLPLHLVLVDGASEVAPTIEDPFEAGKNLGTCMNDKSLSRLREELARANQLCGRVASLTELLEPWVPAAFAAEKGSGSSPDEREVDKSAGALNAKTM